MSILFYLASMRALVIAATPIDMIMPMVWLQAPLIAHDRISGNVEELQISSWIGGPAASDPCPSGHGRIR
jgi:hypothetical protein